jgi:spermidine/putrescine transport system substrate-binding protein
MSFLGRFLFLFLLPIAVYAEDKVLNIYAWSDEIPDQVVRQFEKETGIKVNHATYDNNEIMYAKLRATPNAGYDIINPSSYFVDRMQRQGMLEKLDKTRLSNLIHIAPEYLKADYDPGLQYSIPHVAGITGIFINTEYHPLQSVKNWSDFWESRYYNQLLLLDDTREVFSMALLTLGYSVNDKDPEHIKLAFLKLKELMKNVKVFSSETVKSIVIDEDATLGMAWNGDVFKAAKENRDVKFIFPKDGFVIWVDSLVIPKEAPHKENAYLFLNFIMRPDIAKEVALHTNFMTTNLAAKKLLPEKIRNNPSVYPPKEIMRKGQFQTDIGDETATLLEKYWEQLKIGG